MKFNATVVLTLLLLAMMLGSGFVSAMWGLTLGHQALKGVTQPDVSPTKKLTNNQQAASSKDELEILQEQDILVRVYDYVHDQEKDSKTEEKEKKKDKEEDKEEEDKEFIKSADTEGNSQKSSSSEEEFSIKGQDQGVTLEVVDASQKGGSLLLEVNLKNEGTEDVRFLYSFLDVKDDQGRALSAITNGLPGELPANGNNFSGTVRIPTALLEDSEEISLTLTDYPEQKLQLKLSEIPVVR